MAAISSGEPQGIEWLSGMVSRTRPPSRLYTGVWSTTQHSLYDVRRCRKFPE